MITINVEKISVRKQMDKLYSITLKLTYLDGENELLSKEFTQRYRTGDDIELKIAEMKDEMKEVINELKVADSIFTNKQLDSAVSKLKTDLSSELIVE